MSQAQTTTYVSYRDYVKAEAASETKHEWLDGIVYAMAGGTPEHGALTFAIGGELRNALRDRPCRVFSSDVRVRVRATGRSTYPDASIVCGRLETDPEDDHTITNPIVLVEVLSDSTEASDRGEKFEHYRRIPSLREYVLVSQHKPWIEVYRRNDAGFWELHEFGAGASLELTSVGARLHVDEIYRNPLEPASK